MPKDRNVNIIEDTDGKKIVVIHDIKFKGKRSINWDEVKEYLKTFVGEFYEIADTEDVVYIGNDLPNEYTGSIYTYKLHGTAAKQRRMPRREYRNFSKSQRENISVRTGKKSTAGTLNLAGTDMIPILRFLCMMKGER